MTKEKKKKKYDIYNPHQLGNWLCVLGVLFAVMVVPFGVESCRGYCSCPEMGMEL